MIYIDFNEIRHFILTWIRNVCYIYETLMKSIIHKLFSCSAFATLLCAGVTGAHGSTVSMQIVADNDFAMFVGTSNSVDRLIYQNDKVWMDQLLNASVPFALQQGETTFFLLGMGGGGQENISGSVNGVDLTNIPDVAMSSDLGPSLTLFGTQSSGGGLVEAGFYNASILDVQAALPTVTWGALR